MEGGMDKEGTQAWKEMGVVVGWVGPGRDKQRMTDMVVVVVWGHWWGGILPTRS